MPRPADDLPSKIEIFEYWKDRLDQLGFFVDWGEPSCWVCGFHYRTKYDIKRSNSPWYQVLKCWEKIPLQRCHIVPRSLGGSNKPDNIFLMCRECHDTQPNSSIPEIFFEWARSQNFYKREFGKILAATDAFAVVGADFDGICDTINSNEFKLWVRDKFGLHWPQSNYAPSSSRLTPATMIGLVVAFRRQFRDHDAPSRKNAKAVPRRSKE